MFCSFRDCLWVCANGTDDDLHEHLREAHAEDLQPIAVQMLRSEAADAILSAYNAAVSEVCRKQAPVAGSSIDRTALKSFTDGCKEDNIEALVCFSCACVHTRLSDLSGDRGAIRWCRPLRRVDGGLRFLDRPLDEVVGLLSLDLFLERYDTIAGDSGRRLTDSESFDQWSVALIDEGVDKLLCCPEDSRDLII